MNPQIDRLAAALADRYRIERELGMGGMATVYLAHDIKHDRKVALKVLKPELAAVLGADRFVQEIKTTAALQHPHILPLFDSGVADSFLYYVMPFIDGETLRSKLDRETQLGIDESVRIATNIADALDYAHRHGVIHRDIKPENILLHEGRPMVADFGIALAVSAAAGGRMTETGLSLGTPHYMSPEQATAEKDIGARSDIYSLASVLYEMLAGQPPHLGGSAQQIIMKIITEAPRPVTELRKSVPPHIADALATALEKLPADRFTSASEFAVALQGVLTSVSARARRQLQPQRRWLRDRRSQVALVSLAALALFAGVSEVRMRGGVAPTAPVKARLAFAPGDRIAGSLSDDSWNGERPSHTAFAISPDGSTLVYAGERAGVRQLFVRLLTGETATPLAGTEGGESPFISPDGSTVAYWVKGHLMRVPLAGGAPAQIAEVERNIRGGDWYGDRIVVGNTEGLIMLSAAGTSKPDTITDRGGSLPRFLPGGKAIIFSQQTGWNSEHRRLEVLTIASGERKQLIDDASDGRYLSTGHIVFARAGTMMAVPFDARRLEITGTPVVVVSDIMHAINGTNTGAMTGAMQAAVSSQGHLLYLAGGITPDRQRQIISLDRQGHATPLAAAGVRPFFALRLSPDETKIAVSVVGWHRLTYVFDLVRSTGQSLPDPGPQLWPLWSHDARRILRTGIVNDSAAIVWSPADGSRPAEPLISGKVLTGAPSFWSMDGSELFARRGSTGNSSLVAHNLKTGQTRSIGNLPQDADFATLSPDGKWLAYSATETGTQQREVYVQPWPALDRKWKVSRDGGWTAKWTKHGSELLYTKSLGEDTTGQGVTSMLSVALQFEPDYSAQLPKELFRYNFGTTTGTRSWDATGDGSRILVIAGPLMRAPPGDLLFVANWATELQRLVPRKTP
jgi:eukaryotic-like serine/threonine-protein kinase